MDEENGVAALPYAHVRALMRHPRAWTAAPALAVLAALLWLAWRSGWPELVVIAPFAAAAVYAALRVAVDVIALVLDTLMPR